MNFNKKIKKYVMLNLFQHLKSVGLYEKETKLMQSNNAFTLAEMMVVLLILSIVMAAFLPVITTRTKADRSSPWKYASNNSDIFYGLGATQATLIGINSLDAAGEDNDNPKLAINMPSGGTAHIAFKENGLRTGKLFLDANKNIGIGSASFKDSTDSISIGMDTKADAPNVTVLGTGAMATLNGATALGRSAKAERGSALSIGIDSQSSGESSISMGANSFVNGNNATAIGYGASALGVNSIALGSTVYEGDPSSANTKAVGPQSIAIGTYLDTGGDGGDIIIGGLYDSGSAMYLGFARSGNSVAIGMGAQTEGSPHSINLGTHATSIKSDGGIVLGLDAAITASSSSIAIGQNAAIDTSTSGIAIGQGAQVNKGSNYSIAIGNNAIVDPEVSNSVAIGTGTVVATSNTIKLGADSTYIVEAPGDILCNNLKELSDKRLKNIKGRFEGGLNEIKKLQIFNFTFKEDKQKIPMVGVMAQDLQKIFPNSVSKGKNGYLMVSQEEMFYAMINAIKELDNIIQGIVQDFKSMICRIEKIEDKIAGLIKVDQINSKKIKELEAKNKQLEERLAKLERVNRK